MQAININRKPDKTAESHLNQVTEYDIKQSKMTQYYFYKSSIFQKFQIRFDFSYSMLLDFSDKLISSCELYQILAHAFSFASICLVDKLDHGIWMQNKVHNQSHIS